MSDDSPSTPPFAEDLRIARGALNGDRALQERFAERVACVPRMVRAVERRMSVRLSSHESADLGQDVLTLVWKKLGTYEGRAPLENWVLRFIFLELRNLLRRRDLRRDSPIEELEQIEAEIPETISPEAHALLTESLDELDPPAPDVLRLRHHEQLTFDQIGIRLDMPGNSAKTIYHRSLAKLRAKLAPRLQGEFQ